MAKAGKRWRKIVREVPWAEKFLPPEIKKQWKKPMGLGAPLGKGLSRIKQVDWLRRQETWRSNLERLEEKHPGIFTNEFFYKLKRLGVGGEGEVREFVFPEENPFLSVGRTGREIKWQEVAVKKFIKGAKSTPENQARTLHSLNLIRDYLEAQGKLLKTPFEIRVAEAIAFKGPFLVMRHLGTPQRLEER